MKKGIMVFALSLLVFSSPGLCAEAGSGLKITGAVRSPLEITMSSLETLSTSEVQLNDIVEDGKFNGVFEFKGVPLGDLLDLALVEKKETDFKKPIDLALLVRNNAGQMVTLSWGEVFFRNKEEIILATSAKPVYPKKGIDHFENKDEYHQMIQILNRTVSFPRLIVRSDFYTDRSIEGVTAIEVYDLRPDVQGKKSSNPYSESFEVTGNVMKPYTTDRFDEPSLRKIRAHVVGEGRGYHGTHDLRGVSLKELIMAAQPNLNLNTVFLVSASDAYRSLLSYGELFLNPHSDRILVASEREGTPIKENGKFIMVVPDDLFADREVKAVIRIEVISLEELNR
jgi:DMSO/TMAO reductase YedYZ molybdopterin-dependent catalytic subunit